MKPLSLPEMLERLRNCPEPRPATIPSHEQRDNFRQVVQEEQCRSVQVNLKVRTAIESIERDNAYLYDGTSYVGSERDWEETSCGWLEFKSAMSVGDEVWEYEIVSRGGSESGYAIVRQGHVVEWFCTSVTDWI